MSSWDRTAVRGVYGTLNVYDARTGQRLRHIEHGAYPIASLTWSADGTRLMGGTWDWNLLVWDTRTWAQPRVLPPPESPDYKRIEDFALSPDGSRLTVAYADGRARTWDLERLEVVRTLHSPTEGLTKNMADVAYLPAGDVITTVGGDLTVRLWAEATGSLLAVTDANDEPHEYGMRYWMGLGGTAQHGCLWGASPGREPAVFWDFFTAWDPSRRQWILRALFPQCYP